MARTQKFFRRFLIPLILFSLRNSAFAEQKKKITIVLDAGHGGRDSGAVGKSLKEKDIALKIVKELGEILEKNDKIEIIYTRTTDVFVEVAMRSRIARAKADLFISIHINSSTNPKTSGLEAYVMAVGQLSESSEAAIRENNVIKLEKKYKEVYKNISISNHSHILYALQNQANYEASLKLGNKIISKIAEKIIMKKRSIGQDRLVLFYRILVPSVLIEVGYISNKEDEQKLKSPKEIKKIASAIAEAIYEFNKEYFKIK